MFSLSEQFITTQGLDWGHLALGAKIGATLGRHPFSEAAHRLITKCLSEVRDPSSATTSHKNGSNCKGASCISGSLSILSIAPYCTSPDPAPVSPKSRHQTKVNIVQVRARLSRRSSLGSCKADQSTRFSPTCLSDTLNIQVILRGRCCTNTTIFNSVFECGSSFLALTLCAIKYSFSSLSMRPTVRSSPADKFQVGMMLGCSNREVPSRLNSASGLPGSQVSEQFFACSPKAALAELTTNPPS